MLVSKLIHVSKRGPRNRTVALVSLQADCVLLWTSRCPSQRTSDPDNKVHGANLWPTWPRWAPCGLREPCYLAREVSMTRRLTMFTSVHVIRVSKALEHLVPLSSSLIWQKPRFFLFFFFCFFFFWGGGGGGGGLPSLCKWLSLMGTQRHSAVNVSAIDLTGDIGGNTNWV